MDYSTRLEDVTTSSGLFKKKQVNNPSSSYLDSAKYLADKNPLRAIDLINTAIELSIINNDVSGESTAYLILGNIQQNLGQHEMAITNYKKCISTLSQQQKKKIRQPPNYQNINTLFSANKNLAASLNELNKINEAFTFVNYCFEYKFQAIPKKEKLEARRLLAEIYRKQGKAEESMNIYKDVLAQEKLSNNSEGEINTLMAIGTYYLHQKNETKAQDYFTQSKTLATQSKNQALVLKSNDLLAGIFRIQKNVAKEIEIRQSNITFNTSSNNFTANGIQNYEIGNAYANTNQLDKAIPYFEKGYGATYSWTYPDNKGLLNKSENMEQSATVIKTLAQEYLKKGETKKGLEFFEKYSQLQDSIKIVRKKELENALNLGTNLGKNQQRIDLLEKERQLSFRSIEILKQDKDLKEDELGVRNTIIGTLVFCMVIMIMTGFIITKNSKEKRKANQLLAIKSLRGQMNPHFIFNALNSVNHYISKNDERAANKYLSDFSKLMRSVMDSSKHDFIALSDEIETLKLYLSLEHSRFTDKFDYTFFIDESLDTGDFELPPMIIQPYIENAVWHGLRYLDEKGLLEIMLTQNDNELVITIKDNGIGRKKSAELKTKNQKTQVSVAIQNIENRISIMNQLYKVNIRATVNDAFPESEHTGTVVEIFIPKKIQ